MGVPVFLGCHAAGFLEFLGEITLGIVLQTAADLGQRIVGVGQQIFGFPQLFPADIIGDGKPRLFPELEGDAAGAQTAQPGHVADPDALMQMLVDVIHAFLHVGGVALARLAFLHPLAECHGHLIGQNVDGLHVKGGVHLLTVYIAEGKGTLLGQSAPDGRPGQQGGKGNKGIPDLVHGIGGHHSHVTLHGTVHVAVQLFRVARLHGGTDTLLKAAVGMVGQRLPGLEQLPGHGAVRRGQRGCILQHQVGNGNPASAAQIDQQGKGRIKPAQGKGGHRHEKVAQTHQLFRVGKALKQLYQLGTLLFKGPHWPGNQKKILLQLGDAHKHPVVKQHGQGMVHIPLLQPEIHQRIFVILGQDGVQLPGGAVQERSLGVTQAVQQPAAIIKVVHQPEDGFQLHRLTSKIYHNYNMDFPKMIYAGAPF